MMQHRAQKARLVTAGLSTAAAFGIVAAIAADDARETLPDQSGEPDTAVVEIRISPDVDRADAAEAVRDWLDGGGTVAAEVVLVEQDRPPDTVSRGS